jgi:NAD+ synthase (glutamine-hydrolysing)
MAMGYATLYGDMCGGLGVLSDVTKQQVYALAQWINRDSELIPQHTIDKPPSAELRPNQKDSDSLPDYAIIDAVLEDYVEHHRSPEEIASQRGYSLELVQDLIQRIHRNEYKRRQSAPGLRVSQKAFSVGRRFPIVQKWV